MNIFYGNNKIRKQLSNASEIKKSFGNNAKNVSRRIAEIIAASNLTILMKVPAAGCHALTGDMKGDWALNISVNHRLIFEITHSPVPIKDDGSIDTNLINQITLLRTEDYH